MRKKTLTTIIITALVTMFLGFGALMVRRYYLIQQNLLHDQVVNARAEVVRLETEKERERLINELDQARAELTEKGTILEKIDELRSFLTAQNESAASPEAKMSDNTRLLNLMENTSLSPIIAPDYRVQKIIRSQWHSEERFLSEYAKGDYTLEEPFVVIDPYEINPLSAYVMFRTEKKCRIGLKVEGDAPVEVEFDLFNTEHRIPVLGLYENRENRVILTATDEDKKRHIKALVIRTDTLRQSKMMNNLEIVHKQEFKEFVFASTAEIKAIDCHGNVRYVDYTGIAERVTTKSGTLLKPMSHEYETAPRSSTLLAETDIMGKILKLYYLPMYVHHDLIELQNGNIMVAIHDTYSGNVEDFIMEIDKETGDISWDIDLKEILDINREDISFNRADTHHYESNNVGNWCHLNSLWYDNESDILLVSVRNQSSIIALKKNEKSIKWIIANSDNWKKDFTGLLLRPKDKHTETPLRQHSALLKPNGHVLFFNNGAGRLDKSGKFIPAYKNYSSVIEYGIDEESRTFSQLFTFGKEFGEKGFSLIHGAVAYDPITRNNVIAFGANATDRLGNPINDPWSGQTDTTWGGIIVEIDSEANILFQVNWNDSGAPVYRAEKEYVYPQNFSLDSLGLAVPTETFFDEDYFNPKQRKPMKPGYGFKTFFSVKNNSSYALDTKSRIAFRYLSTNGTPLGIPGGEFNFGDVPPMSVLTVMHSNFDNAVRHLDADFIIEYELKHDEAEAIPGRVVEPLRIYIPVDTTDNQED